MKRLLLPLAALLMLGAPPARADGCVGPCYEDSIVYNPYLHGPFYGDPRWAPPHPRARPELVPPRTPLGAVTPEGEVAYPLAPGHLQAAPDVRHAFPRGIPPAWQR